MPQHKSCKKRVKTSLKSQMRNRSGKSTLRLALRKYREMTDENKAEAYPQIQSLLDKASGKGFIPRNRAARLKSRLMP